MNTLAWQGQTGEQGEALSDFLVRTAKNLPGRDKKPVIDQQAAGPRGPLDSTFGPLLTLTGKNSAQKVMAADSSLSLQTWLTRITRVRLKLQQVANAADPQAMMQQLAQTVFRGRSLELTDTQEYGSLVAASLGEAWRGFGQTMFVQPLTQAREAVLQPSAASLNEAWQRSVVANWNAAFQGRYPFAAGKSDASLPMLAAFIGSMAVMVVIFILSRAGDASLSRLLLVGIAINALCGALVGVLSWISNDTQLRQLSLWGMGSLGQAEWSTLLVAATLMIPASLVVWAMASRLNLL
ncbi:iron chelate uptake ABC transporter family permease subunit, partial [Klebsiella oxytoca]|uniref:iron chelate uptake ABC transporter family permease subunit n=1 Tax=Klebsiella oxytoca TaxID=571 RepID=UPI00387E607F